MSQSRIDALTKMLAGDPSNVMVRYGLANEYWKMANYEAVIEQLTAYLKATDDQGAGYRMLGQAYHKLGNLAEARAAWLAGGRADGGVVVCAGLEHHGRTGSIRVVTPVRCRRGGRPGLRCRRRCAPGRR